MHQLDLVHGDIFSALRTLVDCCGGSKVIAPMLWPAKSKAENWLDDCLNPDRPAKLCIEELIQLLRIGRERGWHHAKYYLDDVTFYERSTPANPSERKAALQERFLVAKDEMVACLEGVKDCEEMERNDRLRIVR